MLAPEAVLRAGNETISRACIYCRNESCGDAILVKLVNDIMEAIHEVPRMLVDWKPERLEEIRIHLGCFNARAYPGAPDLVLYFNNMLEEFGWGSDPDDRGSQGGSE